jgi:hypothetical protein
MTMEVCPLQICQLTAAEAERVQDPGFLPDCHFHEHLSRCEAAQAVADGKLRFVSRRAVVAVGSVPLSAYWYDEAIKKNDRHLGMAKSGAVRTRQLLNFMPRAMRRKVRHVAACGAHGRVVTAKAVNAVSPVTNRLRDQESSDDKLA